MIKFIYFSMAVVAFSFLIVPLFSGVSQTREDLAARTSMMASIDEPNSITDMDAMAEQLNAVQPAAGAQSSMPSIEEDFSAEIKPKAHPAL